MNILHNIVFPRRPSKHRLRQIRKRGSTVDKMLDRTFPSASDSKWETARTTRSLLLSWTSGTVAVKRCFKVMESLGFWMHAETVKPPKWKAQTQTMYSGRDSSLAFQEVLCQVLCVHPNGPICFTCCARDAV